jgi:hypothetical protein
MRAAVWAGILAAVTVVYIGFVAWRGWFLLGTGDPILVIFGLAIAVLPVLGIWFLWRELRFGFAMQRMGRTLADEGGLPQDDLPRTPAGRAELAAADEQFAFAQQEAMDRPDDWRAWYRLAIAYDDARDRRRAREAMREAVRLFG